MTTLDQQPKPCPARSMPKPTVREPKVLLILRTHIGDCVMGSVGLRYARNKYPNTKITVICGYQPAELFKGLEGIGEVFPIERRRWLKCWQHYKDSTWDCVVDMRGSFSGLPLLWKSHTRHSTLITYRFLRHIINLGSHNDIYLRSLPTKQPLIPLIQVKPKYVRAARIHYGRAHNLDGHPILALCVTAFSPHKIWPLDNFVRLGKKLLKITPKARLAIFAAKEERAYAAPFFKHFKNDQIIDCIGLELPMAHACLQLSQLYIGHDSGLTHMSGAAGIPTMAMFGPTDDRLYAPSGLNCTIIRTPESAKELHRLHKKDPNISLMTGLSVERVFNKAKEMLATHT